MLWPLGGLAYTTGSDRSPFHEFVITLAGPLVSLVLALVGALVVALYPAAWTATLGGALMEFVLRQFRNINAMLFLFNMLVPLFPMDSARLVRSFLSMRYTPEKVTYNLCLAGFFVGGVMVALYFVAAFGPPAFFTRWVGFMLIFIAVFGIQSCLMEMRRLETSYVYSDPFPEGPPWRELPRRTLQAFGVPGGGVRARVIDMADERLRRPPSEPPRGLTERERLERELEEAVHNEEFGRAAELRDRLRNLTAGTPRQ
jgi:hypothetical protein